MTISIAEIIEAPAINVKCVGEYEGKAIDLTRAVSVLIIKDQESYETAVSYRKTLKKMQDDVEASRKTIVNPLNQVKDAVQALFNPIKLRIENSKRHVEGIIDAYEQEQERKRLAEEERQRKISEAAEEKERKRLAAIASRAEASGNMEKAEDFRQQVAEVFVPNLTVSPTIQKVAGTSTQERWSAEVTDLMSLVKSVAEGKAPLVWLEVNQTAINKQATATKNSLQFPGIKFVSKRIQMDR